MKSGLPPLIWENSKILILGTMPGEKSIALQQYYGNKGNHFWKIMFDIFGQPFSVDYNYRKLLLQSKRIALWNVLARCERTGSRDDSIANAVPNDLEGLFEKHPEITTV